MAISLVVDLTGADPSVHKLATAAPERERLLAEAAMLALAQHPGVVEVADLIDTADATQLTLRLAGDRCPRPGALAPLEACKVVRSLAITVATLHRRGITHGRIGLAHMVFDPRGTAVLCGFGQAVVHTGADPARFERGQAADVAALGELLTLLLAPGSDVVVMPERRHHLSAEQRRSELADAERRSLLTLADQAAAATPEASLSAFRFAELLDGALPDLSPTDAVSADSLRAGTARADPVFASAGKIGADSPAARGEERLSRPAPLRRRLPALPSLRSLSALPSLRSRLSALPRLRLRLSSLPLRAGGLMIAAVAGLLLLASGIAGLHHGARPRAVSGVDASAPSPHSNCRQVSEPAATLPGDECPAPVSASGRTVFVGARHFELGRPGDVVAVGAWRCDASVIPALLRPSTGEIFLFTTWASPGHDVTVHPAAVVPGARALAVKSDAAGCASLTATMPDGSSQAVPITPAAGA